MTSDERPHRRAGGVAFANKGLLGANAALAVVLGIAIWTATRRTIEPAPQPVESVVAEGGHSVEPTARRALEIRVDDSVRPEPPNARTDDRQVAPPPARAFGEPERPASSMPPVTHHPGEPIVAAPTPQVAAFAPEQAVPRGSTSAPRPGAGAAPAGSLAVPPARASAGPSEPSPEPPNPDAKEAPPTPDPSSDRTPPVLDGLTFVPAQVADGGEATLLIRAHDDLAGVRGVTGNLRSPSGTALVSFAAAPGGGDGEFVAKIPISKRAETGLWFVSNLFVSDRADNTLVAGFTRNTVPSGGTVLVVSPESDAVAPDVRGAWMDRSAVSAGEHNTIVVDVIDDRSGVAAVDGWFQSPRGSALIPFTCRSNGEGGAWSGDVPVPPNADCGTWTLKQLRVSDVAGNSATLGGTSPRLDRAAFGVSSDGCDATPPTLGSFFVSPAFVSNDSAAQLKVTAIVNDDASGVVAVSGWVYGPAATSGDTPKISFSCSREGSSADAPWTGRILVPQYAARGTWRVGRVAVKDKAQNVREYMPDDPEVRGGAFEVQ